MSLVQWFEIQSLKFSKRMIFCFWEYVEIANSKLLMDTMCSSLPGLSSITSLNTPHISINRLFYIVNKLLINLFILDLSSSRVTACGVRYLAWYIKGQKSVLKVNMRDVLS